MCLTKDHEAVREMAGKFLHQELALLKGTKLQTRIKKAKKPKDLLLDATD